ncbi:4-(cytidine 5'-diphospho)-2-C-methyl-D-erythritol kinase [Planctomyces sp. SH-PL14]|uniref:4-(cytidine 5'-diphospho)-2-C-methyl-D-erythritol kinase n=1 Tax=Planctomyces sp. SH-PL14 TaxID=1632864 RepID=UPI00078CD6B1|nr:4-(cytidine 5'-diphospho)-2-C-methyl-D-erythritol kinase [Planctomyces sp. SH-PL14]AMV18708.1 4-diphosphocytidyl-2-C-methyl-D-erythritol kinase [Planctomyces sp. SH-PL14]
MLIESSPTGLTVHTPAKVNLFLNVLRKRPDGYHDLETVMLAVSLFDTLTFEILDRRDIELSCDLSALSGSPTTDAPVLSSGDDNLVVKAARLIQTEANVSAGARIGLLKRIPMQAGLGGGSSDAAATLVALNRLWNAGLSTQRLHELAARLGSDVNFFLESPDLAICRGRGERIEPRPLTQPMWLVLVKPAGGLSTRDVFQEWARTGTTSPLDCDQVIDAINDSDFSGLPRVLWNSLEAPARQLSPEIQATLDRLRACHPGGLLMSGSGTSCFAVCGSREEAETLAGRLSGTGMVAVVEGGGLSGGRSSC